MKLFHLYSTALFLVSVSTSAQLQSTTAGDAFDQGDNCFVITPDQFNQAGGVWFSNPIDFDEDFTIYYQNNFGNKDGNGADGMAMVFKGSPTPEIGNVGGGMGYEGITNSLIIEFDTFLNGVNGDPFFDHLAILRDGNPSHNAATALTPTIQASATDPNIEDGIDHEVKIVWVAASQTIEVYFDCVLRESLTADIKTNIFNGDDTVYFGFVGSTGGLSNLHQVCFNSISFVDDLQLQDEEICSGEFVTVDATIPSGVSYSWSPLTGVGSPDSPITIISPQVTTTYTVTILDNCGDSTTEDITIDVLEEQEPLFDPYPVFNLGDAIPLLPNTSINGITGSWSPPIDNTQTTTYTFTPDTGQCATIQTLTIVVVNPADPDGDGIINALDIDDDNDGILDVNEQDFQNVATAFFDPAFQVWQTSNLNVQSGEDYQMNPTGFSLSEVIVSGGPYDGQIVQQAVIFAIGDGSWVDLDGNFYDLNHNFLDTENSIDIPFANLLASDYSNLLTYIGMIDTNGNGNYDSGIDEVIHPIFSVDNSVVFTPSVSGELFIVFADNFYNDNVGTLSFDTILITENDSDEDGIIDRLDLDADNDGIPDNIEAQPSINYILPSGISTVITDVDGDGLDDNYDADVGSISSENSIGLIPVDTDGDGISDFVDDNSDNDLFFDIEENGFSDSISNPFSDTDGDGIDDIFDNSNGFDVNNNINDPTIVFPDCDNNVQTGGDLDYREEPLLPDFDVPDAICAGGQLDDLPLVSNNGISGTWSPAIDNTQTTTYTFTPDDLTCGLVTSLEIVVNDPIIPVFDSYPVYDFGATIPPLPNTSNNGISGTWSPPIDNTQTTLYTFTPDGNQCVTNQTLTITVNPLDTDADGIPDDVDIDDDNDGILDVNEQAFESVASAVFDPAIQQWQFSNISLQTGSIYQLNPTSFNLPQTTVNGGPFNGQTLQEVVIFDSSNDVWSDLNGNTYNASNTYSGTFGGVDIPFANLQASDYITQLTYIGLVDTNGNGNYDAGIDEIIEPIFAVNEIITFEPSVNGDLYIVYTDSFYADNLGELSFDISVSSDFDTDADGIIDRLDLDSDNDGIPDNIEAQPSIGYVSPSGISLGITDVDGDGLDDNYDQDTNSASIETSVGLVPVNTDSTDNPDFTDEDSDNDGFPDIEENGMPDTISNPFTDSDGDGIDDVFDVFDGFDVNNNIDDPTTDLPDCDNDVFNGGNLDYRELPNTPSFAMVDPICEGDVLEELPSTSNNGITGTWSPPLDNTQTTVYTFTPEDLSCGTEYLLEIVVNPPETPIFSNIDPICLGDQLEELPTTSNNGISGTWSPALDNTQTTVYTFTPNEGECAITTTLEIEVSPLLIPIFEDQPEYCEGDDIAPLPTTSENSITGTWSPAIDNTQTTVYTFSPNEGECAEQATITIEVIASILPEFSLENNYCIGDAIDPLPTISDNGISGSWSPDIDNTSTTTYTFTPDEGQGCVIETTFTITIEPAAIPEFDTLDSICEGDAIEALPETSLNGISGSWSPAIDNTQTTVYTFTPNEGECAEQTTLTLEVIEFILPEFSLENNYCIGDAIDSLPTISDNGISGSWTPDIDNTATTTYTFTPDEGQGCVLETTFTIFIDPGVIPEFDILDSICEGDTIEALPTTSENGITGTWSPAIDNTQTTVYTFTPNEGECAEQTTLTLEVIPSILPEFSLENNYCIGDAIDPLPTISDNGISGSWSPDIDNTSTTTYTFTPDEGQGCVIETTFTITIDPGLIPEFDILDSICEGDAIGALPVTSLNGISGSWSPDFNNLETTNYTFTPNADECAQVLDFIISVSPVNEISLNALLTSAPFRDNISVQLQASGGDGDYEYRVNGGPWQSSSVFEDLQNNSQYVFEVRQANTCSNIASDTVTGLSFPDFFTPNGDGINDYWNITDLREQGDVKIYIFDRYGKLIEEISTLQVGWDGTYNGRLMPSQDYWFLVEFTDEASGNRISYNNHFTLKR